MAAEDHLSDQFSYRGNHRPFHDVSETAGAHEMDKVYPDYYDHPEWYHSITHDQEFNRAHRETIRAMQAVRGQPDAEVTAYRAVPHGVDEIHPGDWVTPSKQYARIHAMQNDNPSDDWPVISKQVKARHLRTQGDYAPEFGYAPED